jgi:chromosomal replication initiation ATPase DnaA
MESLLALREIRDRLEELHTVVLQVIVNETPTKKQGEEVVIAVLKYAGISMGRLTDSRKGGLIFYKRIMCYIMYDYCKITFSEIAKKVYLKSHATVKHHVDKMRWWMSNPQYAPSDIVTTTRNILNQLGYDKK